jgi:hypothetical protein
MPAAMPEYAWLFGVVRTVGGGHALLWAPAGAAHALSFLPSGYPCRFWLRLRHGCVVGGARAGCALPALAPARCRAAAALPPRPSAPSGNAFSNLSHPARLAGARRPAAPPGRREGIEQKRRSLWPPPEGWRALPPPRPPPRISHFPTPFSGANDVANAFATSVGAKTLKLWHAVLLAIVFEFTGALLLGRVTTSVIAGGIAVRERAREAKERAPRAVRAPTPPSLPPCQNVKDFQNNPEAYAYGMVIALSVGFFWQWWASWKGLNVSATHSIIAGIMGFSLVWNGVNGVNWATPDRKAFPP